MAAKKEIDFDILAECLEKGMTTREAAETLDCSHMTISRRIGELQKNQGILMRYRSLQSLQLTGLQARILEAITPEKIADAPLRDLVLAFKILKENELTIEGKPKEFKGLVGYLIQLEKEEVALATQPEDPAIDADFAELPPEFDPTSEVYIPKL
jgi:DNA-binding Lrp family transcriptional regulator